MCSCVVLDHSEYRYFNSRAGGKTTRKHEAFGHPSRLLTCIKLERSHLRLVLVVNRNEMSPTNKRRVKI